jgi:hypothetical protein
MPIMSFKSLLLTAVMAGVAALTLNSCADFANPKDPEAVGTPGDERDVSQQILLTPETKWVNVRQYQTVKFSHTATGKSFVWNFGTRSWSTIDLSTVAPAGTIPSGQQIIAYVKERPRE